MSNFDKYCYRNIIIIITIAIKLIERMITKGPILKNNKIYQKCLKVESEFL